MMRSATSLPLSVTTSSLEALRKMEWNLRHNLSGTLSGEYRSTFKGRGMEFDQVVKYVYGDEVRDIDWNVTARLGEPYRKKYVEEREVTVLLLFADTPSLQMGSTRCTKREALLEMAALLMLLGTINRDCFSLLYWSPSGYWFRGPRRNRQGILQICAKLLSQPPAPVRSRTMTAIPWKFLAHAVPRHSVFLWLGDFGDAVVPEGWRVLQRRYQTMGFRIEDPWERDLPSGLAIHAFDPDADTMVALDTSSRRQRQAHQDWRSRREALFHTLFPQSENRISFLAGEPTMDALLRFFRKRHPSGRGSWRKTECLS